MPLVLLRISRVQPRAPTVLTSKFSKTEGPALGRDAICGPMISLSFDE